MFSRPGFVRVARRTEAPPPVLRNDIPCGILGCSSCPNPSGSPLVIDPNAPIIIPDAQTLLHYVDIFEDPAGISNVVLLTSVLASLRSRNRGVYNRVQRFLSAAPPEGAADPTIEKKRDANPSEAPRAFFAFENSKNERTSLAVLEGDEQEEESRRKLTVHGALWYADHARHVSPSAATILACDDEAMATIFHSKANSSTHGSLQCMSLLQLVTSVGKFSPAFVDRVSLRHASSGASSGEPRKGFEEYLQPEDIERQLEIGVLFRGRLRVSEGSPFVGEIRPNTPLALQLDDTAAKKCELRRIRIVGKYAMNRAIHGDVVAVRILHVSQWQHSAPSEKEKSTELPQHSSEGDDWNAMIADAIAKGLTPCGEVAGLLEVHRRPYCGSLDQDDVSKLDANDTAASVLFQPKSNNIPRIRLLVRHNLSSIKTKRLAVVIDEWPAQCSNPLGHYVEVIGEIGDKDTEAKVILIERDVPHYDFPLGVLDCLPKGDWKVTDEEAQRRVDLRDKCICSVDPLGCRDIDDALHFCYLDDGKVEVGVHIADVTHFVTENTPLDEEAAKRGTSVYLVDRRINMLPQLLTENLCSIVAGEDRYAFSFLWIFDAADVVDGETTALEAERKKRRTESTEQTAGKEKPQLKPLVPLSEWCGKTIIRSRAALYYGDAQKMIDDENDTREVSQSLRGLFTLSKRMKRYREQSGALFLSSQQFSFKFVDNEHVNPTDMTKYQLYEANSMVEEWMLYANVAAARQCYQNFPHCALLRRHETPDADSFNALNDAVEAKTGLRLDISSSYALNRSFQQIFEQQGGGKGKANDAFFHELVRMLSTRCLKQAQYFASGQFSFPEFHHYGLAMELYTHFTSPIRRYADIVVHRQLTAAIAMKGGQAPGNEIAFCLNFDQTKAAADMMNYRHEQAQKAGRDSVNLFTGIFLRSLLEESKGDKELIEDGYIVRMSENAIVVLVPRYGQEAPIPKESLTKEYHLLDRVRVAVKSRRGGDVMRTKLEYHLISEIETSTSGNVT